MNNLYHFPLCPFSRQIRVLLKEKDISFSLIRQDYWLRDKNLLALNPAGELPIYSTQEGNICGIYPLLEYLAETLSPSFMDFSSIEKAEVRRIVFWLNKKLYREVTKYILDEKMIRLFINAGSPRSELLRNAKENLNKHLKYITKLIEDKEYIATSSISVADFVAASHLSVLDFFDEIAWDQNPALKHWYSLIKSRPSFRPLLLDRLPGFNPPKHYSDLDF
jgi:glutathione S-transferase